MSHRRRSGELRPVALHRRVEVEEATIDEEQRAQPAVRERGQQAGQEDDADGQLAELVARNRSPATILLARPTLAVPDGPWQRVLNRPVSVGEIVAAAQTSLPLSPEHRHPLDG